MSGVTPSGFVVRTEDEIFDDLAAEARATIAPTLNTSPDSVFGQIAGIVASKQAELWEVLQAVYGGLSENGSGAALDRIAALTGTFRKPNEPDAALRVRRRVELADAGSTTQPGLRAALSRIAGVVSASAASNRSMTVDAAGRPAKSSEAIVQVDEVTPELLAALGKVIWENLPVGIDSYGTYPTPIGIVDEQGNAQTVKVSIAAALSPYVRISVRADATTYPGDEALRAALVDFVEGALTVTSSDGNAVLGVVPVGGVIYRSRLSAAASSVPGVAGVLRVEFSDDGATWVDSDKALGPRQYLVLNPERITVVRS